MFVRFKIFSVHFFRSRRDGFSLRSHVTFLSIIFQLILVVPLRRGTFTWLEEVRISRSSQISDFLYKVRSVPISFQSIRFSKYSAKSSTKFFARFPYLSKR